MDIIKTEKGHLTLLTGKTDMGKSTITIYECSENLRDGQKVMFFSYEYCQSIIYNKLISHFKVGWAQLFNLNIVDASDLSLDMLLRTVRAKKDNVDVIYIDYLDLLRNATYETAQNEEEALEQIQEICRTLASLANELNIPVILLSQVGASSEFEKTVERLNLFTEKVENKNAYKMFIGKGNVINDKINFNDLVHIILVDGYDLRHFSTINIKEIYGDL